MILSEYARRWQEVRFYYFVYDIYHIRKSMLDVVCAIETMAQINDKLQVKELKRLASVVISDPTYLPIQQEIIVLGHLNGVKTKDIAEHLGKSPKTISKIIKDNKEIYYPSPRLSVNEDETLLQFLNILDIFRKAGI